MYSFAVISKATKLYYDAVVADDRLRPIFNNVNVTVLRYHVALMLNMIMTTREHITREQLAGLKESHESAIRYRGATQHHFDLMMAHLESALITVGADSCELIARLAPVRAIFPKNATTEEHGGWLSGCCLKRR